MHYAPLLEECVRLRYTRCCISGMSVSDHPTTWFPLFVERAPLDSPAERAEINKVAPFPVGGVVEFVCVPDMGSTRPILRLTNHYFGFIWLACAPLSMFGRNPMIWSRPHGAIQSPAEPDSHNTLAIRGEGVRNVAFRKADDRSLTW